MWEEDEVLQVPSSALFRRGDKWAVFVVDGEFAQLRAVQIGRRSGFTAQILSGVEAGELVITHPDDSIEAGVLSRRPL